MSSIRKKLHFLKKNTFYFGGSLSVSLCILFECLQSILMLLFYVLTLSPRCKRPTSLIKIFLNDSCKNYKLTRQQNM